MANNDATTLAVIYYTGDIFTPDDMNANVYGEPCEDGYGETVESGWWDPDFSTFVVFGEKSDVQPDTIESDDCRFDDGMTLDEMIESDIGDRLGAIDSFDGVTAYAADPVTDYGSGKRLSLAAHVSIRPDNNALLLASQVLKWASTPGPHGQNPYTLPMVATAERISEWSE